MPSMNAKHLHFKHKLAAVLESEHEEMEGEFLAIMLVLIAEQLAEYPDADRRYQVSDEFFETEFHKAKREIGTGKRPPQVSWALH